MRPTTTLEILSSYVTIILLLSTTIQLSGCEDAPGVSFCGNTQYDPENLNNGSKIGDHRLAPNVMKELFMKKFFPRPSDYLSVTSTEQRIAKLASTPFPVRLRVLYDAAFEEEFQKRNDLELFVRNLLLASQMVYEKPEMRDSIKFYFVVVKLERVIKEFPIDMSANDMLAQVNEFQGPSGDDDYDTTFMLFYKHIFDNQSGPKESRLLGMATVGSFCNKFNLHKSLLFKANSVNIGIIVAHEFAHTLNVLHDGEGHQIESNCKTNAFIMAATSGEGKDGWSRCTVEAIQWFLSADGIFECVYDKKRFRSKPISDLFDFSPNSSTKLQQPGQQLPLDRQCQMSFDKSVLSAQIAGQDPCKMLYCIVDTDRVAPGPALPGSDCNYPQPGRCLHGSCRRRI